FGLASIGTFIIFDWPPIVRVIVLGFLVAFICFRAVELAARIILRPHEHPAETALSLRIMPVDNTKAIFWYNRVLFVAGAALLGLITIELMRRLGSSLETQEFMRAVAGTVILAIVM